LKGWPGRLEGRGSLYNDEVALDLWCETIAPCRLADEVDSPSAVDPWHRLPVRRMVAATCGRYNFVLPYGRVIKRYGVERTAEPVEPPVMVTAS
jgi:hypothetical protein